MGYSDFSLSYEPRNGRAGRPCKAIVDGKQQCSTCKEWKALAAFGPNKITASGLESRCKPCNTNRNQVARMASPRAALDCLCRTHKQRFGTRSSPRRLEMTRNSSVTVDVLVDLWDRQGGRCAVTGRPMTYLKGNRTGLSTNVSLDRIDNSLGYDLGNIRLVCKAVNYMKNVMTDAEMLEWCRAIIHGLAPEYTAS